MQLKPNTFLQNGKYRIIRVLGQGGFGITYLAEHTMLDKLVAIKEFFPKEYCDRDENTSRLVIGTKNSVDIVEMLKCKFIKEAKNISKLNHKNIITIYDIFQENDTAYYVMEYVEGASLSQIIKEQGPMSECKAVSYIQKVADAVGYMHSLSMNHLDLKPANIMVRTMDDEPILIDFGLSKQYDASGGQTSTTPIGISHGFAPIEQYRPGGVALFTPQTDIYALGATLYNLLSGSLPPHYSEILEDGLPDLPASVSQQVANAVEHAMEIKKNKRPASIADFIAELPCSYKTKLGNLTPQSKTASSNKKSGPIKQKSNQKSVEETMMIGNIEPRINVSAVNNIITNDNVEFVDLGLSVLWGADNEAMYLLRGDKMKFKLRSNESLVDYEEICSIYLLPSADNWLELLEKCKWTVVQDRKYPSYKVEGPNGNVIYLPISDSYLYLSSDCFSLTEKSQYMFCGETQYGLVKKAYALNSFVRFIKPN